VGSATDERRRSPAAPVWRLGSQSAGHRFDPCRPHHPVSANRGIRRGWKIGRFCGDLAACFQGSAVSADITVSRGNFWPPVSASKNSVPGDSRIGSAKGCASSGVRSYGGFNPSASNCWLHSAGASRSRATPMPRGKRPSIAALTRSGARNASEMVILT
jgi:hypothetical protein